MKLCPLCQRVKARSEFHRNTGTLDGRFSYCKPCRRDYDWDHKRKRVAAGLCSRCSNPAKPGRKNCVPCIDKFLRDIKNFEERRKSNSSGGG